MLRLIFTADTNSSSGYAQEFTSKKQERIHTLDSANLDLFQQIEARISRVNMWYSDWYRVWRGLGQYWTQKKHEMHKTETIRKCVRMNRLWPGYGAGESWEVLREHSGEGKKQKEKKERWLVKDWVIHCGWHRNDGIGLEMGGWLWYRECGRYVRSINGGELYSLWHRSCKQG